jgi:drug/metabolite transporter (DMT)-like permease
MDEVGGSRRGAMLPYLLLATTMFFWGTAFRATDIGAEHASAVVFSTLRAVPAALVLLLIVLATKAKLPRGRTLWYAVLSGPLLVTLAFEGIAEGTTLAGAANAAVLINTAPFFTLLLSHLYLRERVSRAAAMGLPVGFAGAVLMVSSQLGSDVPTGDLLLGMGLALLAGIGFAVGTLLVRAAAMRDGEGFDALGFTAVQFFVGAPILVPLMFLYGDPGATDWGSGELLGAVAWVALGSSALAAVAFVLALRVIPATRASTWQFLAPVVAVLVELFLGDAPGVITLIGMVIAVCGVVIVSVAPVREERSEGPTPSVAGATVSPPAG